MTDTRRLDELGRIVTGRTPPTARPELFGADYPFLTPTEMDDRKTIAKTERGVSEAGAEYLRKGMIPEGSLCVSCIGWQLGKVVKAGVPLFTNQQINTIIPNDQVDADYLYYVLKTLRDELHRLGSVGSRTPIVNKSRFGEIRIPIPELCRQRQIADTLSAYDDLIENNTRRIAILEEMAQRLYREWFVHFRYPGHESVPLVESELGPIPDGWNVAPLSSIADLSTSQTSPAKFGEELVQHFSLPAFDDGRLPVVERGDEIKSNKFLVEQSCVLLAKLNPKIPRCWLVYLEETLPALASTEFLVLTPKRGVPLEYLFLAVTSDTFWSRLENMALGTSTSHQRVKPADAMASLLVLPPADVIQQFENRGAPLLQLRSTLIAQMKLLRELQSLLLPRMIS